MRFIYWVYLFAFPGGCKDGQLLCWCMCIPEHLKVGGGVRKIGFLSRNSPLDMKDESSPLSLIIILYSLFILL